MQPARTAIETSEQEQDSPDTAVAASQPQTEKPWRKLHCLPRLQDANYNNNKNNKNNNNNNNNKNNP